jgi:hypothetical protein
MWRVFADPQINNHIAPTIIFNIVYIGTQSYLARNTRPLYFSLGSWYYRMSADQRTYDTLITTYTAHCIAYECNAVCSKYNGNSHNCVNPCGECVPADLREYIRTCTVRKTNGCWFFPVHPKPILINYFYFVTKTN